MTFFHALNGVGSLLLVVGLGYALARRGWFAPNTRKLLPRLITDICLPPYLACTIISSFPTENLGVMLTGSILPFIVMSLLFVTAWILGRPLGIDKKHYGLFCVCVSNPNTIFIGIPINIALFGQPSITYVLLYYFASTIFFWTIGNFVISRDGNDARKASGFNWQRIISPPLLGFFFGVIFLALELPIPKFIFHAAELVGQLSTPLALLFIGITLEEAGLSSIKPDKDMIAALTGRMLVSPLLMLCLTRIWKLPALMANVFIVQSSLPVLMQVAILSAYYNTDPDFGSEMVTVSTLLCVFTVPVLMLFL